MQNAIEQYGDNASELMAKQMSEFIAVAKSHMQNKVKEDIVTLRETIETKETQIATDERLKRCEQERDWFKKEAIHLDKVVEKLQAEKKELQVRIDDIEQDKRFLSKRLTLMAKQKEMHEEECTSSKGEENGDVVQSP